MRAAWLVVAVAASLLSLVPIAGQPATAATAAVAPWMVELPTLGGTSSEATAINDLGVAVGWSDLPGDAERHAVMWDRVGGIHDLGSLDDPPLGPDRGSFATAINNRGEIVGGSGMPFHWDASHGMTAIPLHPKVTEGRATTINADGVVGGELDVGNGDHVAFLWSSTAGRMPVEASTIIALSDNGRWIGRSPAKGNQSWYWIMGSLGSTDTAAVPRPERAVPVANNLSDAGAMAATGFRVTAIEFDRPVYKPFGYIWTEAAGAQWLHDLGFLTPTATAIDDTGRVAGTRDGHAATWSPGTEPIDLGVLPGDDTSMVLGLSNAGQAVGFSSRPGAPTTDGLPTEVHRAVRWGLAPPLPPTPWPDLPPPPPPIVVAPVPVPARPSFTG